MSDLVSMIKPRVQTVLNTDEHGLHQLIEADDTVLHDPMLYSGMQTLIEKLHDYAIYQQTHPKSLLVVDTDYDTDGIMSAVVLNAALNVFGLQYRIYIPTMANGYGLSPKALQEMHNQFDTNGYHMDLLLTADNGTNAVAGVKQAEAEGLTVLVTDHHLSSDGQAEYAPADVIVNPNQNLGDNEIEPYPFKGNAGAAVAWKTMIAYAKTYAPEKLGLIEDLIVFAGIADVSDVMPIVDENHYMVKQAVNELKRLIALRTDYVDDYLSWEEQLVISQQTVYPLIKSTPYPMYNSVFYGLYDLVMFLQHSKDMKRHAKQKGSIPLVDNEELISWYLSPMLNAPRRIHETAKESMMSLIDPRPNVRYQNIEQLIQMNEQKSALRDKILDQLDYNQLSNHFGNVLFVNTRSGISGLIAGQITSRLNCATIVFAVNRPDDPRLIYTDDAFDEQFNARDLVIGGSARSTEMMPLNVIMNIIAEQRPDMVVGGGGHAQAAGYQIRYSKLKEFRVRFNAVAQIIYQDSEKQLKQLQIESTSTPIINEVYLGIEPKPSTPETLTYNVYDHRTSFVDDLLSFHVFEESLRPFGKDFGGETILKLQVRPQDLLNAQYRLNLSFWKTLKFNWYGVEVLTFNISLADQIKLWLNENNDEYLTLQAKLTLNHFRGKTTPQLQLESIVE